MGPPDNDADVQSPENWLSERQFRAAFEHASIGMAVTAPSGELISTNNAFCAILGYAPGELDGVHFSEITHPEDRAGSIEWMNVLLAGTAPAAHWEKRYMQKDGSTVWARVSVAPVTAADGKIVNFVSQIEDVTSRRNAEAAVAASEEKFRLAFDSAASGMALVDPNNGHFLRVNPAGCRMLGYEERELLELTIQDVTAPADREESMTRFRSVVTGEVPSSASKLHYLRRDGSTAYGVVSTALARDSEGRPLHLVANVVDITEQVEAQDRLQSLLESKDQLIASVSHELRTPLTAVLGFAEVLRGDVETLSSTEQVELIESIANQTSDLTNIVEDLLVAARADNDTLHVARVSVNLGAQSAQVVEALGKIVAGGEITLDGEVVRGWGDPARVRQIMRNLITNAFRYGGTNIEVTTYVEEARACIAVSDDGTGIPEEDWERIFEPYERSPGSVGLTASIGLGLTVSRKLANLMKGDLTYRFEDARSIFELALPVVEE